MKPQHETPIRFLKIAECIITSDPITVHTVLGSCLSVVMHSARHRLGGICHALLPRCNQSFTPHGDPGFFLRFADTAILLMLHAFTARGVSIDKLTIKIFGGASMYHSNPGETGPGQKNIEAAQATLAEVGLDVASWDVGGSRGRRLLFNPVSGQVSRQYLVKNVTPVHDIIRPGTKTELWDAAEAAFSIATGSE